MNNIPKSFQLFGNTWNVLFDNDYCDTKEVYGETNHATNTIKLGTSQKHFALSDDRISSTFYHELVHAILDEMHEADLSNNEQFVNVFGNLLDQFFKTKIYE